MRTYWKLEKLITPDLLYSQYRYHQVLNSIVPRGCRWLDLGCGHQMFAEWMRREETELAERASLLVGADLDFDGLKNNRFAHLRVMATLEQLPVPDCSFDLVTANMVVEHIQRPEIILREVHRVLAPGGAFVFHTPNRFNPAIRIASFTPQRLKNLIVRVLERRKEEDVFRTYYRMNSVLEIREAAKTAGLEVIKVATIRSSALTGPLGPFSAPELLFLRILRADRWQHLRSCIISILRKPAPDALYGNSAIDLASLETLQIPA